MRWRRRQKEREPASLAEARAARAEAEARLAETQRHVIFPLRELREENHVFEAITAMIRSGRSGE